MKRLMFAIGMAALIAGCSTPLRITTTDLNGSVREIEVKNSSGVVVQVGNDFRKMVDVVKAAIEAEITAALEARVKAGDFRKEYSISIDAVVAKGFAEPLSDEEKAIFRAIGETLTREYVRQIVYPAWAKKVLVGVLPAAKAKLAEGDYPATREVFWGIAKSGVPEVDELIRKGGAVITQTAKYAMTSVMFNKQPYNIDADPAPEFLDVE